MEKAADDRRFITILNDSRRSTKLDLAAPALPEDPAAVAAWAAFLGACVAKGVSVADARWSRVFIRAGADGPEFALVRGHEMGEAGGSNAGDFRVGLALLMSLLGTTDPDS